MALIETTNDYEASRRDLLRKLDEETRKRRKLDKETRKREAMERVRIATRHEPVAWPKNAETFERADLEPGDVCMPLPPELQPLAAYRECENDHVPEEADATLVLARWSARQREIAKANSMRGPIWTVDIVDARLARAFEVDLYRGGRIGPRGFGSAMPAPIAEMSDLVSRAENQSLRKAMSKLLRHRIVHSDEDIKRADDALCWTATYLAREPDMQLRLLVNAGALWRATRLLVRVACAEHGLQPATFYRKRKLGLERIVAGLIADGRAPT